MNGTRARQRTMATNRLNSAGHTWRTALDSVPARHDLGCGTSTKRSPRCNAWHRSSLTGSKSPHTRTCGHRFRLSLVSGKSSSSGMDVAQSRRRKKLEPSARCIRRWVRQDEDRAQHTTTRAWRHPPDCPIELLAETAGTCQRARRRRESQKGGRPGGLPLRRPARNQALGLTIPCIVSQLTKALNQPVLVVSFGYMPKP